MRSYQQFFAEMKRRRVFRVMAAYGIIGFGIIEAAEAICTPIEERTRPMILGRQ